MSSGRELSKADDERTEEIVGIIGKATEFALKQLEQDFLSASKFEYYLRPGLFKHGFLANDPGIGYV